MNESNLCNEFKVSVIIPTYNHGRFVGEALDSAISQTYKNLEIIVVDDGSTDGTKNIIEEYLLKDGAKVLLKEENICGQFLGEDSVLYTSSWKLVDSFSKIIYIYKKNKGLSATRNFGIRICSGGVIAILDADDVWMPNKIELQLKLFNDVNVGIVTCGCFFMDEGGAIIGKSVRKNYGNHKKLLDKLVFKNIVSGGSSAIIRKECFNRVGLFDENFKSVEDWDMWFRIALFYEVRFVEKPLVKIRVISNSMSSAVNAGKMLNFELKFLNKVFLDEKLRRRRLLKSKAYSYRYYSVAIACKEGGRHNDSLKYFLRSIRICPLNFLNKEYLKFFMLLLRNRILHRV